MASGSEHAKASIRTIYFTAPICIALSFTHLIFLSGLLGLFFGLIATPDLDHHLITHCERRILRFNRFLGILWLIYWWPYMKFNPHRGRSHTWPYGTFVRYIYLLWLPIAGSAYYIAQVAEAYLVYWFLWWLIVFWFWTLQDIRHYWLDGLRWNGRRITSRRRYDATAGYTDSLHT